MTKPCNKCGQTIEWKMPYTKGDKPMNPDGSEHQTTCQTKSVSQQVTQTKVNWTPLINQTKDQKLLNDGLEQFISLAYEIVKKSHPELDTNGNSFGMIVNARTTQLIELAKVKAIKENN